MAASRPRDFCLSSAGVWVAVGREASAATQDRVLAVVDSLRVGPKP